MVTAMVTTTATAARKFRASITTTKTHSQIIEFIAIQNHPSPLPPSFRISFNNNNTHKLVPTNNTNLKCAP